jgi:hypothetical protein
MTTTPAADTAPDPVAAFVRALPAKMRARFNVTATVVSDIHKATARGWTTQQLIDITTGNHNGAWNTGGIIAFRLAEKCAPNDPPDNVTALPRKPLCGHCENGWIYDEHTDPPTQTRCPCRTTEAEA